jgi:hypothetical protein
MVHTLRIFVCTVVALLIVQTTGMSKSFAKCPPNCKTYKPK